MAGRRGGVNACELQQLMGFGSQGTVWNRLQKLRHGIAARSSQRLDGLVVIDESYLSVKGKVRGRGTSKALVLVAAEDNRVRIRIEPAHDASANSIGPLIKRNIRTDAYFTADGWSVYSPSAISEK